MAMRRPTTTADSRKGWGQLVPNNIQSEFILTGDGPSPPLVVRILESAVAYNPETMKGIALEQSLAKICVKFSSSIVSMSIETKLKRFLGFTLIELLVVIAIIAILAG